MKTLKLLSKPLAVSGMIIMCVGLALADAQPGTVPFASGQGSMTGSFTMDPNATTISTFSFSVTAGGGFSAHTYDTSNSSGALSSFFGKEVATFTSNLGDRLMIISFDCGGPSNCFPLAANGVGLSFQLDTISGELGQPDFSPYRQLDTGSFVNLTDPVGGLSFNLGPTVIAGNTLYGTSGTVPEPSSLVLLSSGLLGALQMFRRRKQTARQ